MIEQVDIAYDGAERPIRQTLMGSDLVARAQTQLSYDNEGRPQCSAVRMNPAEFGTSNDACAPGPLHVTYGSDRITRTGYDAANRVALVQTGYGVPAEVANEVATSYTANGRVQTLTDANGNRTTYEYDGHDRLVRTRFPNLAVGAGTSSITDDELLTLDAAGNVVSRMLRDGTSITYSYDALGRLRTKDPPGAGEPTVTYGYDNLGRMTSAATSAQALTFSYDALGRNLTQVGPLGTTAYQYDLAGRRTVLDYPGMGLVIHYDYLTTGEVSAIRENGATSGVGVLARFGYDPLGRRASLTRGNGTATTYGYDPVSRLASLVQNLPGTVNDLTLGFTYNPASQIATNTRSNDLYSFTGHANQSVADTRDGLNRLTATGGASLGYDPRHNIALVPASASHTGVAITYAYNSENMLVSGGGITLAYDPLLRLYSASTSRWAYDGATMIAEYNNSNALLRRFVHGPGVDEPLVWYEGSGTSDRRWLHADERGSIIAISDGAGAVIGTNRYDEYGMPTSPTTGRFHYTGQMWIASLGLYYYRARFYNPRLGRFMQTDPIGYGSGMNLYAYVLNDPVNLRDPSGLAWYTWCVSDSGGGSYCHMTYLLDMSDFAFIREDRGSNESGGAGGGAGGNGDGDSPVAGLLEPPEDRRPDETFEECVWRVADVDEEIAAAAAGFLFGLPLLPYPRGVPPGGTGGTSVISQVSRDAFRGMPRLSARMFGTRSFGGAIGRAISRTSVVGAGAMSGFAIGKIIGAMQVCSD